MGSVRSTLGGSNVRRGKDERAVDVAIGGDGVIVHSDRARVFKEFGSQRENTTR